MTLPPNDPRTHKDLCNEFSPVLSERAQRTGTCRRLAPLWAVSLTCRRSPGGRRYHRQPQYLLEMACRAATASCGWGNFWLREEQARQLPGGQLCSFSGRSGEGRDLWTGCVPLLRSLRYFMSAARSCQVAAVPFPIWKAVPDLAPCWHNCWPSAASCEASSVGWPGQHAACSVFQLAHPVQRGQRASAQRLQPSGRVQPAVGWVCRSLDRFL